MTVALVTAAVARGLDDDLPPLTAALDAHGVPWELVDWDDPAVDWAAFDLAVVADFPSSRSVNQFAADPADFGFVRYHAQPTSILAQAIGGQFRPGRDAGCNI